jgi:para-nitrobenzyl esterase
VSNFDLSRRDETLRVDLNQCPSGNVRLSFFFDNSVARAIWSSISHLPDSHNFKQRGSLGDDNRSGQSETNRIQTDKGKVRCSQFDTHLEGLGIPYAAPPVGDLRLRAPIEHAAWTDVRDATKFGPASLQTKTEYDEAQGSEDCLYLNVYSPAAAKASAPIPVMVWHHGGGFVSGSGNAFYGAYLARTANAVVVTVNYRLGPLGWLGLPSLAAEAPDHSTGNYGLLDYIAALKWVKRNISAFGGDPGRVTIFGQSAGGEVAFGLVGSPLGAGLFHRAISMSAPAAIPLPTVAQNAASRAKYLAKLGCSDEATQIARLRSVTAKEIIDAADESWNMLGNTGLSWTPTIDGVVLVDQWINRFRQGKINRVPVMAGNAKDEVRLMGAIYENDDKQKITAAQATTLVKNFFGPNADNVMREYAISTASEPFGPLYPDHDRRSCNNSLSHAGAASTLVHVVDSAATVFVINAFRFGRCSYHGRTLP